MKNPQSMVVGPTILRELGAYLRANQSDISAEQAIQEALEQWIARSLAAYELRGYQWKSLFLPHATELRMLHRGDSYYARVVGDDIIFQGRKVSPRGMTLAIASSARNAWCELGIRFPGTRVWKRARAIRRELEQASTALPVKASPQEAMTIATTNLNEALKTTLKLIEQTSTVVAQHINRRLAPTRRDQDRVHDDCAFE